MQKKKRSEPEDTEDLTFFPIPVLPPCLGAIEADVLGTCKGELFMAALFCWWGCDVLLFLVLFIVHHHLLLTCCCRCRCRCCCRCCCCCYYCLVVFVALGAFVAAAVAAVVVAVVVVAVSFVTVVSVVSIVFVDAAVAFAVDGLGNISTRMFVFFLSVCWAIHCPCFTPEAIPNNHSWFIKASTPSIGLPTRAYGWPSEIKTAQTGVWQLQNQGRVSSVKFGFLHILCFACCYNWILHVWTVKEIGASRMKTHWSHLEKAVILLLQVMLQWRIRCAKVSVDVFGNSQSESHVSLIAWY